MLYYFNKKTNSYYKYWI